MSEKKLKPSRDPASTKYPERTWYGGHWATDEEIEWQRDGRRERYASDPEYRKQERERKNEWQRGRRADPNFRRKKTLYMMDYYHRRKHERWADQGLTLRNDGQEGSASGDRASA